MSEHEPHRIAQPEESGGIWQPADYVNPYGADWFLSSCPNHYNIGLAYEEGWRDCILALLKTQKWGYQPTQKERPDLKGTLVFIPDV